MGDLPFLLFLLRVPQTPLAMGGLPWGPTGLSPPQVPPESPDLPVELFLEQIQAGFQVGALAAGQGRGGIWGGPVGTTGKLLVLAAPGVTPKTEDVGDPRESAWKMRAVKGLGGVVK